jgi:hypothetical protein
MSLINKIFFSLFTFAILAVSLFGALSSISTYAQSIPGSDKLCGNNPCPLISNPQVASSANQDTVAGIILNVARLLTFIGGAVAVLAIVYGGILYVTDNGSGDSAKKGKQILINAVIGLIIVIVAYTIVGLVGSLVQGNIGGNLIQNAGN